MSHSHHEEEITGIVKNYTLTVFLTFAMMFFLFTTLSCCHGDYKLKKSEHHTAAEQHHVKD